MIVIRLSVNLFQAYYLSMYILIHSKCYVLFEKSICSFHSCTHNSEWHLAEGKFTGKECKSFLIIDWQVERFLFVFQRAFYIMTFVLISSMKTPFVRFIQINEISTWIIWNVRINEIKNLQSNYTGTSKNH